MSLYIVVAHLRKITKKKTKKIDYTERSDIEKILSNWKKVYGLYSRKEWSSVILRASTSVELAANFVIRKELEENRKLDSDFVNHLLRWANGIQGKFDKLLLPIFKGDDFSKDLKKLKKKVQDINIERNTIAHSGQFKKESTANRIVLECQSVINTLIGKYDSDLDLENIFGKLNTKLKKDKK
ncbi:hypothetical protein Q4599_14890 [Cellulophaga lytica]|uniref:hypothetical protein n=1 Tax=Cellulophaga lytica TaxID=979 RepID=UPI0026E3F122|nr:hypothetical protein [Cellulophaga lytica]MDO6854876.1 hypothetical protein [Cellulophaga lytica]